MTTLLGKMLKSYSKDKIFTFGHARLENNSDFTTQYWNHAHIFYEIFQLLDGSITYVIEGKSYNVEKGDMIIIKKNEFHSLKLLSSVYERRVVEIDPKFFINEFPTLLKALEPFEGATNYFGNYVCAKQVKKFELDRIFDNIQSCIDNEEDRDTLIYIYTLELIMALKRLGRSSVNVDDIKETNEYVTKCIQYIDENMDKPITLDDLEKKLNMSKFYISHLFKKITGISIIKYITYKKMCYAETLILQGESPTVVCKKVGYLNYWNFYDNYKKIHNKPPSQTKKLLAP